MNDNSLNELFLLIMFKRIELSPPTRDRYSVSMLILRVNDNLLFSNMQCLQHFRVQYTLRVYTVQYITYLKYEHSKGRHIVGRAVGRVCEVTRKAL